MNILYDGDFTVAQLAGPPEYEIPFKADPKPYAYKLPYWQFLGNYTELAFGSAGPLGGTYVGGAAGSFKAIGAGIIEFTREYALVPDTRNEFESFIYSYQFWQCNPSCSTAELPLSVPSRIQYDYFRTDTPTTSIGLPRAPHIFELFGNIYLANGAGSIAIGQEFLAEDSVFRQWKGNIYERVQRFITAYPLGDQQS